MIGTRRLTKPTLAIFVATGIAISVPAGDLVEIAVAPGEGIRTVDVVWKDKELMMFVNDLRERSTEIGSQKS